MAVKTGPLELKGSIYLADRTTDVPPFAGLTAIGRLQEVLYYRIGVNDDIGRKGDATPTWARITGDFIEIEATFVDVTTDFMKLITNGRNNGSSFLPKQASYKYGHLLRDTDYNAVVIKDESDNDMPMLYIPYCYCAFLGWFAARAASHTSYAKVILTSIDYEGDDAGNDVGVFEYGDYNLFANAP